MIQKFDQQGYKCNANATCCSFGLQRLQIRYDFFTIKCSKEVLGEGIRLFIQILSEPLLMFVVRFFSEKAEKQITLKFGFVQTG
ncbi:hypothetical protein Q7S_08550 [Rahnella aquatilis HX2]|nr:hypothetical protein Q7S_08550 [Rahnella aquatilis HX2]